MASAYHFLIVCYFSLSVVVLASPVSATSGAPGGTAVARNEIFEPEINSPHARFTARGSGMVDLEGTYTETSGSCGAVSPFTLSDISDEEAGILTPGIDITQERWYRFNDGLNDPILQVRHLFQHLVSFLQ